MKIVNLLKGAAVGLACLGMALPQTSMAAGPQKAQVAAQVKIADIALSNGTLSGKVVDTQGKVLSGSVVKVSLGNKEVASTVSGQNGEFAVKNLTTGVYQVSTGQTRAAVRLWEGQAAPPSAKKHVLLVNGPVTRAQLLGGGLLSGLTTTQLLVGGAVIAGTATAIAIAANNNDSPASP